MSSLRLESILISYVGELDGSSVRSCISELTLSELKLDFTLFQSIIIDSNSSFELHTIILSDLVRILNCPVNIVVYLTLFSI